MKISNNKIHWFNPGHEDAIRVGTPHYTPPASVCRLMSELAFLPAWYANENDYIIINEAIHTPRFLLSLPETIRPPVIPIACNCPPSPMEDENKILTILRSYNLTVFSLEAAPWGLSPHSIRFFETLRSSNENIIIPPWKETYKTLTGRQTALECLSKIRSFLPGYFEALALPHFCTTEDEIRQFTSEYSPPYILKTPFSCSGRGLYRLPSRHLDLPATSWIKGSIRKQGCISIEPALEKVCDFAMEFESDGKGHIHYKGSAVFNTLSNGSYTGNMLGSSRSIEKYLSAFIPVTHLREIRKTVASILTDLLSFEYRGYLGIDMLIYRKENTFAIHPFIEINLRYTMGLVALQISKRLIHPSSTGQFMIAFNKKKYSTFNTHLQMQEKYPLRLCDSKIQSGYLALCPVLPESQYHAYILVS
ncbi:MAG: hypothetical protein LBE79_03600 [Tannerella sp.]|jgi:hypothetical protein|nr:hypothetical protein [Tannerella sp.]